MRKRLKFVDAGSDIRTRLAGVAVEDLVEALMELSIRHDDADAMISRLISSKKDNFKRAKAKILGLRRQKNLVDWRSSRSFRSKLDEILAEIRDGAESPSDGITLLVEFFKSDKAIIEHCDDSDGFIGDIFRFSASDLFTELASKCKDKKWISEILAELHEDDTYSLRKYLLKQSAKFLPSGELRKLAELFMDRMNETKDDSQARQWAIGAINLAEQLNDPVMFEKASLKSCEGFKEIPDKNYLQIAEAYFKAGDCTTSLAWLNKIPKTENYMAYDRNKLLFSIYKKTGDKEKMHEIALKSFRNHRSENNLKELLEAVGKPERPRIIEEETGLIMNSACISLTDADFLLKYGKADEAEEYLVGRADQINGDNYPSLLELSKKFEAENKFLASSLIHRALINSILKKAQSKYYVYAVRYLKKLDAIAEKITDCKKFPTQDTYKEELRKIHRLKSALWAKYGS
ncbi:MAG TPA: hypothetical protein DET40_18805 [Lentisphaeria bacterium]|nr:MAG: hypothetical protein A2X45_25560 [Lentisphaerae bacterium GWF2_50_93]HCE45596.1 hypothetical protein [Lentisphaeria bacterium]